MTVHRISTMREVLRQAAENRLEDAWIYLKDEVEPQLESQCLVMADDANEEEPLECASALGFPQEGLDTTDIENCAVWARLHEVKPSDKLLLYAFRYYWRFDNFPDQPWAPDPPTGEAATISLALEFYRCLGPERPDVPCRREGCTSGAVHQSVLCRRHHYEMIRKEPCPFHGDA